MSPGLTEIARRVSNWGRWGADDERGTVNFITPEVVQRAARCVRRGQVFSLGLELGENGPQFGQAGRVNPLHIMTSTSNQMTPDPAGLRYADDVIVMPLQCATQWDSLAHVHYGGSSTTGTRSRTSRRRAPRRTASTRWPPASSRAACYSTSRASAASSRSGPEK